MSHALRGSTTLTWFHCFRRDFVFVLLFKLYVYDGREDIWVWVGEHVEDTGQLQVWVPCLLPYSRQGPLLCAGLQTFGDASVPPPYTTTVTLGLRGPCLALCGLQGLHGPCVALCGSMNLNSGVCTCSARLCPLKKLWSPGVVNGGFIAQIEWIKLLATGAWT